MEIVALNNAPKGYLHGVIAKRQQEDGLCTECCRIGIFCNLAHGHEGKHRNVAEEPMKLSMGIGESRRAR